MFSVAAGGLENLTILEIDGKTLAIEAPAHITVTAPNMKGLRSKSSLTKIDAVIVTHIDADHAAGIDSLIWHKIFGEKSKFLLITHKDVYDQLWKKIEAAFATSRIDLQSKTKFEDYAEFFELKFGKTTSIEKIGVEIETFSRSTKHKPILCIAFRIVRNGKAILAYSGDTSFDPELIEFLAKDGKHPIMHEAGSYGIGSKSHTHIEELLRLPIDIQKRLYINHIPKALEQEVRKKITDENSPIKIANELNEKEIEP